MSPFPHRKKNVTISVRCGARCRAYHASSMGEGKGPPHNCAPARFLFFGLFSSRRLPLAYKEFPAGPAEPPAVRTWCVTPRKALILRPEAPRRRPGLASGAPDVVRHAPQSLLPPSGHANLTRIFPARRRLCWRRPPRKTLTLRRATPTWPGRASGNSGFPFPIRRECDEHI